VEGSVCGDNGFGVMEDAIRNGGGQSAVGRFIDLRQHERRIDGKSAEYLSCFGIVEGVETALERFAVKSQNGCAGGCCAAVEVRRVTAPPVVQQRQSVRPPRQARRRRAIAGRKTCPIRIHRFRERQGMPPELDNDVRVENRLYPLPSRFAERRTAAVGLGRMNSS